MFKFLTNLDCEAKVLFSHIGVAVNQLGAEIRYADHLAACKTKETKDKIKSKVDDCKTKREEKKAKKAETKSEKKEEKKASNNTETTSKEEKKGADINVTVDVNYNPKDENEEPEVVVKNVTIKEDDVVIDVDPSELKPVPEIVEHSVVKPTTIDIITVEPTVVEPEVTIKPDPAHEKNIPLKMGVLYDIEDDREDDNKSQKIKERKAQVTPEDVDIAFEKKVEEARKQHKKK